MKSSNVLHKFFIQCFAASIIFFAGCGPDRIKSDEGRHAADSTQASDSLASEAQKMMDDQAAKDTSTAPIDSGSAHRDTSR